MTRTDVTADLASNSDDESESELSPAEKWWRDHYELFKARGYRLRPRYRPDWIPSWKSTGKNPIFCEDYIWNRREDVIDATREDGRVVYIKRVGKGSRELAIALYLSPKEDKVENDSTNHCVPILDHFGDDSLPQFSFLVMPLLRRFNDPPFYSVDEVLDFIQQTLQGLSYMHSHGVAHRDCAALNIMLEASSLYPRGFHPVAKSMDPSGRKVAPVRRRREAIGVRYYFIDFGISTRFEGDVKKEDKLVTGFDGQDRDVPELSDHVPYDPFAVDVFILGNVYRKQLLDKYSNLAFLSEFAESMTATAPEDRPSADKSLEQLANLIATKPNVRLRWRLKQKDAGIVRSIFEDLEFVAQEGLHISRKILALPQRFFRK